MENIQNINASCIQGRTQYKNPNTRQQHYTAASMQNKREDHAAAQAIYGNQC
jgi:hypothetical protein